jgi:hypothetical protein
VSRRSFGFNFSGLTLGSIVSMEPSRYRSAALTNDAERFRPFLRLLFPVKSHPLLCADDLVAITMTAKIREVPIFVPGDKSAIEQLLSESGIDPFGLLIKLDRKQYEQSRFGRLFAPGPDTHSVVQAAAQNFSQKVTCTITVARTRCETKHLALAK